MSDLVRRSIQVLVPRSGSSAEERAILIDDDGAHQGPAIEAAVRELGARLAGATAPGDRVLIVAPRGLPWLVAFLACVRLGRVAVPLAEGSPAAEVEAIVERAGVRCALVAAGTAAPLPPQLVVVGVDRGPGDRALGDQVLGDGNAPRAVVPEPVPGSDPALFLFTSGTTGRPKAAVITHDNLAAQVQALQAAWQLGPSDVLLHALPLHHTHGVVVALLATLLAGGRVCMLPRFDPHRVWDALGDATVWMAVPTMTTRLLEAFDAAPAATRARWGASARGLRLATSGSAALPVGLAERWRVVAGEVPLERYGMTEIGMALSNPLEPSGRRTGTVGGPLPGVEARLVDEAGTDAGAGPGELWVRGPSVFAGYFGDETATRASFADGGWFRTGDVARREDGVFRLLGRASVDILKTGGEKVSALEIEEALRLDDAVAEVAVVGVPDPTWGDRVVAFVVPAPGRAAACTAAAVRARAKTLLAPFKVPRDVIVVDALPRNAMGKVQKPALVERARAVDKREA